MSTAALAVAGMVLWPVATAAAEAAPRRFRWLPVGEYRDRMKAGWIGQMAGVGWGGPTEFRYRGRIIPPDKMPKWRPGLVNQFRQDDLYVEMTFLRTLETHGLGVSIRQAGLDFAATRYPLWHANAAARANLRRGIAPPDSGHPRFNRHADDIDYQIEADYAGLIAPGLPNLAIELGETFGRVMNDGDGVYAGQFVAGMYAEAFFETDRVKIVRAGLSCIPPASQYHQCISDVLTWQAANGDDWEKTWRLIEAKYNLDPAYRRFSCGNRKGGGMNIDAKINGAYAVMGLLYGRGEPDRTIVVATRCGQDSDCNPATAGGVLFTTIGFSRLPARFTSALNANAKFSHTPYDFAKLTAVCEKLARQAVLRAGGRIEKDPSAREVFVIPVVAPRPGKLRQCWQPGEIANSRFTDEELARLASPWDIGKAVAKFAPGWRVRHCGRQMEPGLRKEFGGKKNVLVTHPLTPQMGCDLSRRVHIPAGGAAALKLLVGHHPRGDWLLIVRADGRELLKKPVDKATCTAGWMEVRVDLSDFAGKTVKLELLNQPTGWRHEAAYWARIALEGTRQ